MGIFPAPIELIPRSGNIQRQLTPARVLLRTHRQDMTDMRTGPQPSFIPLYTLLALGFVAIALLVSSTRAEEPIHLDRVVVYRYTDVGDNKLQEQSGVLHMSGSTQWQRSRVLD